VSDVTASTPAEQRDIGQAIPAKGERNRQIADHLARIMNRHRLTPPCQRPGQHPVQPRRTNRLDQRDPAGLRHHTRTGRVGPHARIQPVTLHHQGAPRSNDDQVSTTPIIVGLEHFSSHRHAATVKAAG
jgi:hypothetical protein